MLVNKYLKFPYMAPAEEGADLGGAPTGDDDDSGVDYGHDYDPSLFEEEDDAGKPPAAKSKEEEEETDSKTDDEPDPAKKPVEGEDKGEGEETDAAKAEDDKKKDDKPEGKKPSRSEKRIQQLLEEREALRKQLERKTGDTQVAEQLTTLETQATKLEKDYHAALSTDPEKAESILTELRGVDRKIARLESAAEAEAIVEERLENREFQSTVTEICKEYAELDLESEEYDAEKVAEINDLYVGLLQSSPNKSAAMRKAVRYVMGDKKDTAAPAAPAEPKLGDEVRATRKAEGVKRAAAAAQASSPDVTAAGTTDTGKVKPLKSIKDLDNLSEEELAVLRGDFV